MLRFLKDYAAAVLSIFTINVPETDLFSLLRGGFPSEGGGGLQGSR